jgi:small GTP-binding protein
MNNILRTNRPIDARILTYEPRCIIMGKAGVGKTALVNKLCNTNHASGAASSGVLDKLFRNKTKYCGDRSFEIIDTPGTDSRKDTYRHAFQLRAALTVVPYNTIFIVLKYDARYENIVQGFRRRANAR